MAAAQGKGFAPPYCTGLAGTMEHIPILAAAIALGLASAASAQDSATTAGTAQIEERGGIEATGELIFQNLEIPNIALPLITSTSTGDAHISVMGDDAMVSLAVPDSIDMTMEGGLESLTVLTALDGGEVGVLGMQSLISPGGTLSVDVGGHINVRPEDLAPGEYRGLLVVVAQYN